jgi:hypothetical protein
MHPRDDDQLVTGLSTYQSVGKLLFDLKPRVRRTFPSLPRRLVSSSASNE